MRTCVGIGLLGLLACGPVGCGKTDNADNSHIQTPNDQPLGMPGPIGGRGAGKNPEPKLDPKQPGKAKGTGTGTIEGAGTTKFGTQP